MREHSYSGLGPNGFHRLHYYEWGDAENPRVVLCVHGLTRNGRDFDALAHALSDHYRVICPDVIGRGKSGWLSDRLCIVPLRMPPFPVKGVHCYRGYSGR